MDCTVFSYPPLFRVNGLVYTQFSGTVMGESGMNQTSDVGSLVEFTFLVSHLHFLLSMGPSGVCGASHSIWLQLTHISLIPTLSLKATVSTASDV